MKKNVIMIGTIVVLTIILGILVYLYFKPADNTFDFQNIKQGMAGETQVDLSTYVKEDYVFNEETDDSLDVSNKATISLSDNTTISGSGAKVDNGNVLVTAGGEYTVSGSLNGSIIIETENKVKLNLAGVTISSEGTSAINAKNTKKLIINLVENTTNTISDNGTYDEEVVDESGAIFSNDPIVITGSGSLVVNGNRNHAIASDDYILIRSGNLTLNATTDGLHANDHIGIKNGNITIPKSYDGMDCDGGIVIDNGSITISAEDDALHAESTLIINNGNIAIKTAEEGIESKKNLIVNGGNIDINVNDDGMNSTYEIEINGGVINCNCTTGDGIDSNGYLTINGGEIILNGGNMPEGGIDNDNNQIVITGGTLIATGGTNTSPSSNNSTQNSILLGSLNANSTLVVKQNGKEMLSYTSTKSCANILISSSKLETGKEYTVEIDGKESTTFTINQTVTNVNGNGGMGQNFGGGKGGTKPNR